MRWWSSWEAFEGEKRWALSDFWGSLKGEKIVTESMSCVRFVWHVMGWWMIDVCWWHCTSFPCVSCHFLFLNFQFILMYICEWCWCDNDVMDVDETMLVQIRSSCPSSPKTFSSFFLICLLMDVTWCRIIWEWRWYDENDIVARLKLVTQTISLLLFLFIFQFV